LAPHRVEREDALEDEIGLLELGFDQVIEVAPGVDVPPGPIQLARIDPADPLLFEASGQVAEDAHGALSLFRPVAVRIRRGDRRGSATGGSPDPDG
jgi:hypothetical protein